jgi:uncharacterized protein YjbI with pentapeptide repeats
VVIKVTFLSILVLFFLSGCGRQERFFYSAEQGRCMNFQGDSGLNQGVLGPCSDFRNIELDGANLSSINLSGSDFSNSTLNNVTFANSNLTATKFDGSVLESVDITRAILTNSSLPSATWVD